MRPQDWFGVGLRLLGVWSILQGIGYFANFIDQLGNWSGQYVSGANPNQYLVYIFSETAIGMVLLGFASAITRLTYPIDEDAPQDSAKSVVNPAQEENR